MKRFYSIIFALIALAGFAAYQTVNIGTNPNDGTGDTLRGAFAKVNANTTQTIADFAQVTADITAAETHIINSTNFPGYSDWVTNSQVAVNFGTMTSTFVVASNNIWIPKAGLGAIDTYMSPGFFRTTNSSTLNAIGIVQDGANFNVVGTGLNTLVNVNQSGVVTASNFVHSTWKWVDMLVSGDSIAINPSGSPPSLTEIPGQNYFGYAYYWQNGTSGDRSYFTIQSPHKFAETNAANPAFYFEPHCHILCTNMPAGLSNATFRIDIYYGRVWGQLTNYFVTTNTVAFTNIYQHAVLDFGNVTNNLLSGRASVIFHGRIMRLPTVGPGGLGNNNPVWLESIDIHVPVTELGTTGQFGDN